MQSSIVKYAVRGLGRNVRRTLLSVVGVGVGCAVTVFLFAFMRGSTEIRIRAIAQSGFGHARIVPVGWETSRNSDLRLLDWREELEITRSMDGVKVAAPHARSTALLAFGTKAVGVEIVGVDPVAEERFNRLIRAVSEGRYLKQGDTDRTVIGSTIAERLDVELGDDLLLSIVGRGGEMEYAMLRIVGIVHTGSREIDASVCHVTLGDIEKLTGFQGAGDITILFDEPKRIDQMAQALQQALPERDPVLTWKEIIPAQGGDMDSDRMFTTLIAGIVVIVVILGVTSAQLTAILERKRELAVLMALGMRDLHVIRLILIEAAVVGVFGAAAGLLLAAPLVYYTSTTGFNFASLMGGDSAMSGVLFDPVFYSDMGTWMIPHALIVALVSTFIAALYPALFAIRTNPASALTLREG